jgi:aldehyde dehydrogenase (NAD+)
LQACSWNVQQSFRKVVAGGKILVEGGVLSGEGYESGCYVKPAIAEADNTFEIVQHETLHLFCICWNIQER